LKVHHHCHAQFNLELGGSGIATGVRAAPGGKGAKNAEN